MILPHNDYIGTASETKPTASSIPIGSTYYAYDTKEEWVVTPAASWEEKIPAWMSHEHAIAHGIKTNTSRWAMLGFQGTVVATSDVLWGIPAVYTWPSAAMGMELISDSAADSSAGAGIRSVHIHYLNSSYEQKTEIVTLTGATAVATASTDFYRINYMEAETVGSTGKAVGNVDIRHLSDSPIYGRIVVGQTRARDSIYTVPVNSTLYINEFHFSAVHTAANKYALATLYTNYDSLDSTSSDIFYPDGTTMMDNGAISYQFDPELVFPSGTDLKLMASSNGTAAISGVFRGWLEAS